MAFQPVPTAAKVSIEGRLADEPAIITLGFSQAGAWGASEINQLAVDVADAFVTNALPFMASNYVYEQTVATGLRTDPDVTATSDTASGTPGGSLVVAPPNNVTLAISFRTGLTGRSARGRNFWPGLVASTVTDNEVSAVAANQIAGWYEASFLPPGGISDWTWVVISRFSGGAPRVSGIVTPITQVVIVDTVVDSQRMRLPGRGA